MSSRFNRQKKKDGGYTRLSGRKSFVESRACQCLQMNHEQFQYVEQVISDVMRLSFLLTLRRG